MSGYTRDTTSILLPLKEGDVITARETGNLATVNYGVIPLIS